MLSPKQLAKIEVLKHVSKAMDGMLSGKLKKPAAMHMDVAAIPGHPPGLEGSPEHERLESPEQEKLEQSMNPAQEALEVDIPAGHEMVPHQVHGDGLPKKDHATSEMDAEDLQKLRHHYSKLK